jgi:branched-chain amino acid transport system substrate-binding protein
VVFTETDAATAATFWSEVLQSCALPPVIGDTSDTFANYVQAVQSATGNTFPMVAMVTSPPATGPALKLFQKSLLKIKGVRNAKQYLTTAPTIGAYDAVVTAALAMTAAHSTNSATYKSHIKKVTGTGPGEVVYTYAEGVHALRAGKRIRYSGAGGPVAYNKYNGIVSSFSGTKLNANGTFTDVGTVGVGT